MAQDRTIIVDSSIARQLAAEHGANWMMHPMWKSMIVDKYFRFVGVLAEDYQMDATMFTLRYGFNKER